MAEGDFFLSSPLDIHGKFVVALSKLISFPSESLP